MSLIDRNRMQTLGNGVAIGENAVSDNWLLGVARDFKKKIASRYKLYKEKDIGYLPEDNLLTSLKLDGQLHFLYKDENECFLFNPKGRVITGLPLFDHIRLRGGEQVLLAGELYQQVESERSRVYQVASAIGKDGGDKVNTLAFGAFNLLQIDHENWAGSFEETYNKLCTMLPASGLFHVVEQYAKSQQEVRDYYTEMVRNQGHEGLVCFSDSNHLVYKIKPHHNLDVAIVGFTERADEPEIVRSLLTALVRKDGSLQLVTRVGGGLNDDQRKDLFHMLKPMEVESTYKETDGNHTLFTMVKPELVAEIKFHDLITDDSRGMPQMKAVLTYDDETGYQHQLPEPFLVLISPTFLRLREDKQVNEVDLRLTQLQDFVDLDNLEASARKINYEGSAILQREVYTKTLKGNTNVRKLIAWKTNKEEVDPLYPPYVFCYVDYSPSRKGPLKRVVRTAKSEDRVREILSEFRDKEIKKGWAKQS